MKSLWKFALFPSLLLLLPNSSNAGVEFSGWYAIGNPQKELKNYSYGLTTDGGTARISWGSGEKSFKKPFFFAEFSYVNFGLETGYVADPLLPEKGKDTVTDLYLMMFSSGLGLGRKSGDFRPYFNFFSGVSYYSALSRITSRRQISGQPSEIFTESNGTTWHAGMGVGLKIFLWRKQPSTKKAWLDELFFDARADYIKGGALKYLDWRSLPDDLETGNFVNVHSNIDLFQLSFGGSIVF